MTQTTTKRSFTKETAEALARTEPDWAIARRLEAWRVYQDTPMPTRNDEDWRRTDISALRLDAFTAAGPSSDREGGNAPLSTQLSGYITGSTATVCAEAHDQGVIFTT